MAVYPWELSIEDGVMSAWLNGTLNISGDLIVTNDLKVGNDLDVAGIVQGDLLNNYMVQKAGFDVLGLMTDPRFLNLMCDDPGAGTMIDISGQGHDGAYQGAMTTSDRVMKNMGWYLDMDGNNDYISITDHNDLSFGDSSNDSAVTFFGIIEITSVAGTPVIMAKYNSSTNNREYFIDLIDNGKIAVHFYDQSASVSCYRVLDTALILGNHTIVITYDGAGGATAADTIKIYIDGELTASTATNNVAYVAMENLTSAVYISSLVSGGGGHANFYTGKIGCVGIDGSEWSAYDVHRFHQLMKGLYGL